jgi:CheY-like chemotaxis protein
VIGEDVAFFTAMSGDLGLVRADASQLEQVVINLAVNARDAMPDGGALTIETANVTLDEGYAARHVAVKPGEYVMVAVSDTGCGMDAATRARIFEPFFTTKEQGRGTGLGLSTVYGIVKQCGGNIWVYSESGRGTTFKIYLPRHEGEVPPAGVPVEPTVTTGTETVLVVEDDSLVRRYVMTQIDSLGYTTFEAANASEALQIIDANPALDLLFTDVIMPGEMNGRQLVNEALKRRPMLKTLYTSGYTENAIVHHGRLDSGVLLLAKPYRKSELARMLRLALGS